MKKVILILSAIAFLTSSFASDILILNNEMIFEGKVTKIKDCEVVFKADGKKYIVPASEILSLQFENPNDKVIKAYNKISEGDSSACLKGAFDAKKYHGKIANHILLGMFLGPYAMIITALSKNTPLNGDNTYEMSNNKELFFDPDYLKCYKKKATRKLIGMNAIGTGVSMIGLSILLFPLLE